jgi:type III secretion protein J
MRRPCTYLLAIALIVGLVGCKVNLYSGVAEDEANQMIALLLLRKIPADKVMEKGGTVTLRVGEDTFVNAVEVLRQNGFPQQKRVSMGDLFPSGQLVTSPAQERAKMQLLKEQQLEGMVSAMDGVIGARVSIAQKVDESGRPSGTPSAAIFVKYSPQFSLSNYEIQIRSLIADSVPAIVPGQITVVMQAAEFRYIESLPANTRPAWRQWAESDPVRAGVVFGAGLLAIFVIFGMAWALLSRRRKDKEKEKENA